MGFKLVRVDTAEPYKVILRLGSHLIGRGKLLDCNDNRVSRRHAELIVLSDSILLRSLHQNPCFVKKKSSLDTLILSQSESLILTNGDQFSLIPENFWYEVIHTLEDTPTQGIDSQGVCNRSENDGLSPNTARNESNTQCYEQEAPDNDQNCSQSVLDEVFDAPFGISPENQPSSSTQAQNESSNLTNSIEDMDTTPPQIEDTKEPEKSTNLVSDENKSNSDSSTPSKRLHFEDNSTHPIQNVQPTNLPGETNQNVSNNDSPSNRLHFEEPSDQAVEPQNQQAESHQMESNQNSIKRIHSEDESSPQEVKRIKTEPASPCIDDKKNIPNEASSSNQRVKEEPASPQDSKPGPSNVQGPSNAGPNNSPPNNPASPTKPPSNPLRERCWYGASCYRRNPQHKASLSHPADADWGTGAQAPCPWGATCVRGDPRHWRDHSHPPGVRPPYRRRPRVQPPGGRQRSPTPESDGHSNDGQDNANLVIAGKRQRRPVARQDWSDSENEEEDPYLTDGSDEWAMPHSDDGSPDRESQDSGVDTQNF